MRPAGRGGGVPGEAVGRLGVLGAEVNAIELELNAEHCDVVGGGGLDVDGGGDGAAGGPGNAVGGRGGGGASGAPAEPLLRLTVAAAQGPPADVVHECVAIPGVEMYLV